MSNVFEVLCTTNNCGRMGAVAVNGYVLCEHCSKDALPEAGDLDNVEVCPAHNLVLGEGAPCAECERLAQLEIDAIDRAMKEQQYSLWVLCQKTHLFKVPVCSFNDAKTLYHSLNWAVVSGVRIARYCEVEGCEVVLYKFR